MQQSEGRGHWRPARSAARNTSELDTDQGCNLADSKAPRRLVEWAAAKVVQTGALMPGVGFSAVDVDTNLDQVHTHSIRDVFDARSGGIASQRICAVP